MTRKEKRTLAIGASLVSVFAIWTVLIQTIDVRPLGQNGTNVGFAALNCRVHQLTGVYMDLYIITDWLGLVPVAVCMVFCAVGIIQWVKRKHLSKVDFDIILLGIYYAAVIAAYLLFEMFPINYRPILINGFMEASYPSSTTLLVLSVMPTLAFQIDRRLKSVDIKRTLCILTNVFAAFMVIGRTVSGVHWLTDIIGAVLLSAGMFQIYKAAVLINDRKTIWRSQNGIQ